MKVAEIKCPSCNGTLETEDGLDTFYCKYCGQKIVLIEQDEHIIAAKVAVKKMEHEERMYRLMMEEERKDRRDKDRQTWIAVAVILFICFLFMLPALITWLTR